MIVVLAETVEIIVCVLSLWGNLNISITLELCTVEYIDKNMHFGHGDGLLVAPPSASWRFLVLGPWGGGLNLSMELY